MIQMSKKLLKSRNGGLLIVIQRIKLTAEPSTMVAFYTTNHANPEAAQHHRSQALRDSNQTKSKNEMTVCSLPPHISKPRADTFPHILQSPRKFYDSRQVLEGKTKETVRNVDDEDNV